MADKPEKKKNLPEKLPRYGEDFLNDFLKMDGKKKKKEFKKNSLRHDRFDTETYEGILEEMAEMSKSEDKCVENIETGGPLFSDLFYSLVKAVPKQEDVDEMRPDHLLNHGVMDEAMRLKEFEELRLYTPGDEVAAGLACISMEPELEALFDKLKQEQELMDQMQQQMQQIQQMNQEARDLDEMAEQWANGENPQVPGNVPTDEDGNPDFNKAKQLIEQALEQLKQEFEETKAEVEDKMAKAAPAIQAAMKNAMKEAVKDQEGSDNAAQLWGLDPGELRRLPAAERMELAKKLKNEKFKRLAEIFGPMRNIAFTEQYRKVDYAFEEVYDISLGNDLSRVLPTEFHQIRHPVLKYEFFRRFLEGELLQYELRGQEKVGKGGIICCIDSSGSMSGDPEMWSKAVGLALLHIAKQQKRDFHGLIFGSSRELMQFSFPKEEAINMDGVFDFAEYFFGGGTDFMRPLSASLDLMQAEHDKTGSTKSDIVFITDGMCGVSDDWLKNFKEKQEELGFRVYGCAIGGYGGTGEPLHTICDGRTFTIQNILSGDEMREVFRSI